MKKLPMSIVHPVCYLSAMSNPSCCSCFKPKANLICGICQDTICKKCTQFVAENSFSFLKKIPKDLTPTAFCETCYTQKVLPELNKYNEMMEQAKNILVFMKAQFKETRFVKRLEDPITIAECADYDEIILRLAFKAVELNFNGIIDVDITAKKVRTGNYQTSVFSATAIPANILEDRLIKDKSNWSSLNRSGPN